MQDGIDPLTVVFLGLAIFVAWRLYGVLGQKTGHEKPPEPMFRKPDIETPSGRAFAPKASTDGSADMPQGVQYGRETPKEDGPRWGTFVASDSQQAKILDDIAAVNPQFDVNSLGNFLEGAKYAYEMIVGAFAEADRKVLKEWLSKSVFEEFNSALVAREKARQIKETRFVSIDKAQIVGVHLSGKDVYLTVKFHSKLITCVRNDVGEVVEGSAEDVIKNQDVWVFTRNLDSRDPNWVVHEVKE
jgi:predicted lipid-binding transport protein (Tim44 family)